MSEAHDGEELGGLSTEQPRPELTDLDLLSAERLVSLMCSDVHRVPDAVSAAEASIARAVEGVVARLERGGRLIYVGAGTAGRIGMLDAAEAGPTFNVPQGQVIGVLAGGSGALDVPVENAEDDAESGAGAIAAMAVAETDVVVGIAASGRTPYVLGAIAAAQEAGALTIGLACNAGTPLAARSQIAIEVLVGPEIIAGSTRLNAGTAQKIVLNIISTAAMVRLGKTYGSLMVDLRATNAKLRHRATRIVAEIAGVTFEQAMVALEQANWKAKTAAAMLVGGIDRDQADAALERHHGRLRPALDELAPGATPDRARPVAGATKRLGVGAAYIDGDLVYGDVAVRDGQLVAVGLAGRGSGVAIPGLIDAQVNGYAGVDILGADTGALEEMGEALLRDGVAAYAPTLISSSEDALLATLRRIAAVTHRPGRAAEIVGVHLEGPFLSPERAGTHPLDCLRSPDPALLERLLAAGPVRVVTLAPELPGATELIAICRRHGVVVSLGHSQADAAQAAAAIAAGAGAVTHLFNAMAPMSARAPGLAGAALATAGVAVQLIADGVHVSDELIRVAFAAAAGRCSLVSDAIAGAGLGEGSYRLGTVEVTVSDGVARRGDGTLAGAVAPLADGLARLGRLGIEPGEAVAALTDRPARLLGRSDLGRLSLGGRADLLVLDESLGLARVLTGGRELERAGATAAAS